MATSEKTAKQVADVLVTSLGFEKAMSLITRIMDETQGNSSYRETLDMVYAAVNAWYPAANKAVTAAEKAQRKVAP